MISLSFNIILAQIFLFAARVVEARGLVPCGGTDEPQCQACYLVQMGQSIITFLVSVTMSIVIVMFAVGGFKLLTSAGNPGNVQKGKDIMWNSIIGFIIVLTGFLIIDTIMKAFVDQEVLSPWSQIQCTNPVATTENNGGTLTNITGTPTVSGGTALNTTQIIQKYGTQIDTYCAGSSVPNCSSVVAALIAAESSGRTSVTSASGAVGLMQLLPSNGGANCGADDTSCINSQIQRGVQMLSNSYSSTDNLPLTLASYNGGSAAIAQSGCCPSGYAYECQYDCGGSRNYRQCTSLSDVCTANTGFVETRNYVNNICATIGSGC